MEPMPSYTPWQSWSPAKPAWLPWPRWDYCPLPNQQSPKAKQYSNKKTTLRLSKPQGYWCSWYALGEKITAEKILEQTKLCQKFKLPVDTIIIDDGWTKWGDWQAANHDKFPGGITALAREIKKLRFQPGLWLAPFLASPDSALLQQHPEFFVRDQNNRLVNGFRSFPPLDHLFYRKYLLDFGQKRVKEYIFKSLDQIIEKWGIKVLKLDFLYAPYFNSHLQTAETASRQVKQLLRYLRRQHPEVFVIACGCPFADTQGLVDAIRISKDSTAPPPTFNWLRKYFYHQRVRLLAQKAALPNLWRGAHPDPDVKMLEFDNYLTRQIFSQLDDSYLRGYGDDLRRLKVVYNSD